MKQTFRSAMAALAAGLLSLTVLAADSAPARPPPPQTVVLRVSVDATGHVSSSSPFDPQALPSLVHAAQAYAQKLVFSPARKAGAAVASETNLNLVLAFEPAGEGKYALKLRRATNGPGVVTVGHMAMPQYAGRRGGAMIVVSVDVDAQGMPNMDTVRTESAQLREPNKFAEARYLDAIHVSVKGSRFDPEKVAGEPIASRIMLPYRFGRGGDAPDQDDEDQRRGPPPPPSDPSKEPVMTAISTVPGIELPNIDYAAPAKP